MSLARYVDLILVSLCKLLATASMTELRSNILLLPVPATTLSAGLISV